MRGTYAERWKKESGVARVAADLRANCTWDCALSPLVLMTDPVRMPDVISRVRALPRGAAVIYRHFGKADREIEAQALRALTHRQGQQLLIGNDPELAEAIGADGVHFSRTTEVTAPQEWRARHPEWVLTQAALKQGAYAAPFTPLDALFVSSVFPSDSPSAGTPLGVEAFADRVARLPLPVFALGGINAQTAQAVLNSGAAGLAGVEGLIMDIRKEDTAQGHRFVMDTEAGEAEMTMARVADGVFNANHTFVPKALEGKGLAGRLFDAMAADAIAEGYKVIPGCPYVAMKFKRKPEIAAQIAAKNTEG